MVINNNDDLNNLLQLADYKLYCFCLYFVLFLPSTYSKSVKYYYRLEEQEVCFPINLIHLGYPVMYRIWWNALETRQCARVCVLEVVFKV